MVTTMRKQLVREQKGRTTVDQVLSDSKCLSPSDRLRLAVLKVRSGVVAVK